jgi:hypothetical protein
VASDRRRDRTGAGKGVWDSGDGRVFTPKNYGWGYSVTFAALLRRLKRR